MPHHASHGSWIECVKETFDGKRITRLPNKRIQHFVAHQRITCNASQNSYSYTYRRARGRMLTHKRQNGHTPTNSNISRCCTEVAEGLMMNLSLCSPIACCWLGDGTNRGRGLTEEGGTKRCNSWLTSEKKARYGPGREQRESRKRTRQVRNPEMTRERDYESPFSSSPPRCIINNGHVFFAFFTPIIIPSTHLPDPARTPP